MNVLSTIFTLVAGICVFVISTSADSKARRNSWIGLAVMIGVLSIGWLIYQK